MENASKALLIAGGVLLGIIVLSIAVFIFTSAGNVSQNYDEKLSSDEMNEYNNKYTIYAKNLNSQDMVSLINMAKELNEKYDGIAGRKVTIKIDGTTVVLDKTEEWKIQQMQKETGTAGRYSYLFTKVTYNDSGLVDTLEYKKNN